VLALVLSFSEKGSNENDGQAMALRNQLILQLDRYGQPRSN
jgi:hypothetical protein